ncbi:ATP-dependent DNA helicase UvrD2 [Citricoccus sp. NR2]|uniref:ATP-dependent DNA helicase UvrD2 n=1 Tax=Citricoccus sp. NR2 TaxID=3004095 RepID=UPI0022DD6A6E|nr:ATP-dependent DNA helicase UvrD2 [Citricoccus sp. NR2]WBL20650.1 ATP-dependent DNA helicase UvrD2 [Citricoccus sp. NR2]
MTVTEDILAGLDAEQRQAATALKGPVCILAGAGTGKTRAITHRIAYGVKTGVYDPHRTLAVTFTARAAAEMRSRLRDLGVHGVQARTFHAAALRQLQYFWGDAIGGPVPQLVENKIQLIIEAARRLRLSTDRATVRDLAGEIEWAKVSMLTPDTYQAAAADREMPTGWDVTSVTRLFVSYEDVKTDRGLIDFEDVLLILLGILDSEPRIAATIRDQYRTFVVDEYQDVSPLQQRLLEAWLGGRDDLCVVGDASQTIYSFTGATSEFLLDFRSRYPQAEMIKLVRDYRSSPQIVDLANKLLSERTVQQQRQLERQISGKARVTEALPRWPEPLELISQREAGPEPEFAECADEEAEAEWVAERITQLIAPGQDGKPTVEPAEIAVLFRTNSQSAAFEQALTAHGLSYQLRGAERFFSRREVRDGILQLRAAARSADDVSGDAVVGRVKDVLGSLGFSENAPQTTGAARERWESLNALVELAAQLSRTRGEDFTVTELVAELDERAANQHAPTMQGVTLASLHSAKGLEWDAVFLAGLTEGLMPISFATEQAEIDEERRLLYVGITRARHRLYLSWPQARSSQRRGGRRPSRFLQSLTPQARTVAGSAERPTRSRQRARKATMTCRGCGTVLDTGAERKIGRCENCPPQYEEQTLTALKDWRSSIASRDKVPAFVVFTDATLIAIAESNPSSPTDLLRIPGVGKTKVERYGDDVLALMT